MMDLSKFASRIRFRKTTAATLFLAGVAMLVIDFTTRFPTAEKGEFAAIWLVMIAISGFFYYRSMELPVTEIMAIAKSGNGLLTVSEIASALETDPAVVQKALNYLQRLGIASPRWEELQKNLWEFPDYVKLPIAESIDFARKNKGRISLQDLVASGHSPETAQQTLDALSDKGLAREDPAAPAPTVIMTPQ